MRFVQPEDPRKSSDSHTIGIEKSYDVKVEREAARNFLAADFAKIPIRLWKQAHACCRAEADWGKWPGVITDRTRSKFALLLYVRSARCLLNSVTALRSHLQIFSPCRLDVTGGA